jgi:glycolate oxidase iron-sulfur subunit
MQTRFEPARLTDPDVAASEKILRKCVHCGFCTATCPTYVLLGDELDSPRGRIYLIKEMLESSSPATEPVVRHIDRCLSCLACMTACPSGVHYQHLIDHARVHVARTYRRPWRDRLLRALLARILPYPRRLRASLAVAALARAAARLLPGRIRALARHFPAPFTAVLSLAAQAPRDPRAGRDARPGRSGVAPAERRGRVALLTGCAQSVLTAGAQAASARLLERAGFDVSAVQGCCGALVHHLGRERHNRALAARLLERIDRERRRGPLDAVIVTASGCGTHLKDYGYLFRNDARLARAAAAASDATHDITEWLYERGPHASPQPAESTAAATGSGTAAFPAARLTVAYHSACSMQHGQKLGRIPQLLLERAGFEVQEIPEGHLCCGSAGTYNILEPRIAAQLRERKLENIRRTSARVVATGNVGCIMQLASAPDLKLVHTAELLDWAQGGPEPPGLGEPAGPHESLARARAS